jgi:hypothetical protein
MPTTKICMSNQTYASLVICTCQYFALITSNWRECAYWMPACLDAQCCIPKRWHPYSKKCTKSESMYIFLTTIYRLFVILPSTVVFDHNMQVICHCAFYSCFWPQYAGSVCHCAFYSCFLPQYAGCLSLCLLQTCILWSKTTVKGTMTNNLHIVVKNNCRRHNDKLNLYVVVKNNCKRHNDKQPVYCGQKQL